MKNVSLARRFVLVVLLAIALMGSGTLFALYEFRGAMMAMKENEMLSGARTAEALVLRYEARVVRGEMPRADAQKEAVRDMRAMRGEGPDGAFLLDADGNLLVAGDGAAAMADEDRAALGATQTFGRALGLGTLFDPRLGVVSRTPDWHWRVGAIVHSGDVNRALLMTVLLISAVCAPLIVGFVYIAWLLGAGITRPVHAIVRLVDLMAGGDHNVEICHRDRGDEIGVIARALETLRVSLAEGDQLRQKESAMQANERRHSLAVDGAISSFRHAMDSVMAVVKQTSDAMTDTAIKLAGVADAARTFSVNVQASVNRDATDVMAMSEATQSLSESVREVGQEIAKSARTTTEGAERGREARDDVEMLDRTATKIGEMVDIIRAIAEQTNLLALNATIEAAHAGVAGKGFAVVAAEVKALAVQTAKATGEISENVTAIQSATKAVVDKIVGVNTSLSEIEGTSRTIAGALDHQRQATEEIFRRARSVAEGTDDLVDGIQEVSRAATETTNVVNDVSQVADVLAEAASQLEREVNSFLSAVAV